MNAPMAVAAVSDGRPWVFGVEAVPTEMIDDRYRYWLVRIGRGSRRAAIPVRLPIDAPTDPTAHDLQGILNGVLVDACQGDSSLYRLACDRGCELDDAARELLQARLAAGLCEYLGVSPNQAFDLAANIDEQTARAPFRVIA